MHRLVSLAIVAGAALLATAAAAQNAEQLEAALAGKTFRCSYSDKTDPANVTGGYTMVNLAPNGAVSIDAPGAPNPQDQTSLEGRWWADDAMTVCWNVGTGAQCGIADATAADRITMMSAGGQVPCAAQ